MHVRDNALLPAGGYSLLLNGVELIHGEVVPNRHLAIDSGEVIDRIDGIEAMDPAFGLPAVWVGEEMIANAEDLGYTVADSPTVIITHLSKHLKENAAELVGTEEMQKLIDIFKKANPKVVSSLIPDKMAINEVLKVCKNLLREQLSIRDLRTILEPCWNTYTSPRIPRFSPNLLDKVSLGISRASRRAPMTRFTSSHSMARSLRDFVVK